MCQVAVNCGLSPFAPDIATHTTSIASKKRARSDASAPEVPMTATTTPPRSTVTVDAMHYNLRAKRARPAAVVEHHASPLAAANKVKSRTESSSSSMSRDLTNEVKTLRAKVAAIQAQVQGAATGICELRHMVALLTLQRHRAEMLAQYRRMQQQQQQQQCAVQC